MKKVTVEIIAGNATVSGKKITFSKGKAPGKTIFNIPFKLIKEYEIISLDWEEKSTRSAGKAAAGAIVGGALTGGIGLLAGAALGGKKKDNSTAVVIYLDDKGKEQKLVVRCGPKEYESLTAFLNC